MAVWPKDLACYPVVGTWSETPQVNVVAFRPEVGPPKQRRRSTASGSLASATFKMSREALISFMRWFREDVKDGSIPFTMDHPMTDEFLSWTFEEPPSVTSTTRNMHMVSVRLRRIT
jgi:hypothetical protein